MIVFRSDRWIIGPALSRGLIVAAHLAAILALGLGLVFLLDTTGGTLFLFSALGPILVMLAALILAAIALDHFRCRHALFELAVFQAGEEIIRQGEEADCAYFIQSGEVEVSREISGKRERIATLGPGEYFGEMALLTNEPRNASVRAVAETRVAMLGRGNFQAMLRAVPVTQDHILKTVQDRAMRVGSG